MQYKFHDESLSIIQLYNWIWCPHLTYCATCLSTKTKKEVYELECQQCLSIMMEEAKEL